MSRTIEQIQQSIITDFQAQPELAQANSTSTRALWRLFTFVQASAILLLEQIIDIFKSNTETSISQAIPNTANWLTAKVLEFQYSATNPQIIQLVNFAPIYPVIDASLRLISRCSVVSTTSNKVIIKVAKGTTPTALSSGELASLQDYVNTIGVAGVNYYCTSTASDKIYINADIFYNGQYSSVIQSSVISAINNYLANLPFNGQIKILDLEIAIRNVTGVSDVVIKNLKLRGDSTSFADGIFLIQNKTTISRIFQTISGYVTEETTTGQTFSDTLNFVSYV